MADPLDEDFYNISDTSASDDGQSNDGEGIGDITAGIDLAAIRTGLLNKARGPNFPNFFQTGLQGTFNKYVPQWMNKRQAPYPIRHPAVRPDDVFQSQATEEWVFPSEYAK